MNQLHKQYQLAVNVFKRFEDSIQKYKNPKTTDDRKIYRDVMFLRFKHTIYTCFKYLRTYLLIDLGVNAHESKTIIRTCCENKILSLQEAEAAFAMITTLEKTNYGYNNVIAQRAAHDIVNIHYSLIHYVLKHTKPSNKS